MNLTELVCNFVMNMSTTEINPGETALQTASITSEENANQQHCVKCSHAMGHGDSICSGCGYYETAGIFIEIEQEVAEEPKPFPMRVFFLPVAMVLVVVESLILAYVTHPDSPDRTLISYLHLVLGGVLFGVPQLRAFLRSVLEDGGIRLLDLVVQPFKLWRLDVRELPKSFPWMLSAVVGLTAIFCSLIILRGFQNPFPEMFSPKPATQAVDPVPVFEAEEVVEEDKRVYVDCAIIGYNRSAENPEHFHSLLLATIEDDGQLKYAGSVTNGITDKLRAKLTPRLSRIRTSDPTTEGSREILVKPKYHCRVWYAVKKDSEKKQEDDQEALKALEVLSEIQQKLPEKYRNQEALDALNGLSVLGQELPKNGGVQKKQGGETFRQFNFDRMLLLK